MVVFHLLMTGVLSLKESYAASLAMLPLPVITILFFLFIQQHCFKPSMYLSLNMASGLTEASPHFLQVSDILCDVWCVVRDTWCMMFCEVMWCVACNMMSDLSCVTYTVRYEMTVERNLLQYDRAWHLPWVGEYFVVSYPCSELRGFFPESYSFLSPQKPTISKF